MTTIETVLEKSKGIGRGFDFLRVALAILIVAFHATLLTGNESIRDTPLWFAEYALVPMFFALSGFLITASGMRLSLKNFLINRGMRIVPALAVDIFICALVIGPLMTTVPLKDYYTDHRFWSYFLNIFGYIHYQLPGVFETHINTRVNGALWTVPYELLCYVLISFMIVFKLLKSSRSVALLAAAMITGGVALEFGGAALASLPAIFGKIAHFALVSRNSQIVTAFLFGILAYQLKDKIPYSKKLFAFCLALCLAASLLFNVSMIDEVLSRAILLPAITYITVFLGVSNIPIPKFFKQGDYSYGIYLYHDPFLQVIISLLPVWTAAGLWGAALTLSLGLPIVIAVACCSWHLIEKPILGLRKKYSFVARVRGVERETAMPNKPYAYDANRADAALATVIADSNQESGVIEKQKAANS
ncbi:MAG: acyltransferase [Bdellovibrionales bacterium]